jgi:trimeric autotransporter adhesin
MVNTQQTTFRLTTWRILAIALVVAGIAAAAGVAAFLLSGSDSVARVAAPTTVAVSRGDVSLTVAAPGRVVGTRTETLAAPVPGRLASLNVRPGSVVQAGDVIATVDTADLERAVEQAQARLAVATEDWSRTTDSAERDLAISENALADYMRGLPLALASANADVASALVAVDDANRALPGPTGDDIAEATEALVLAELDLEATGRDIELQEAQAAEALAIATEAHDAALVQYSKTFSRWLGITELPPETNPDALFDLWGVDLVALFDDPDTGPTPVFGFDDPDTAWNDWTVHVWNNAFSGDVAANCDNADTPDGAVCVRQEFDAAWQALRAASLSLTEARAGSEGTTARADGMLIAANRNIVNAAQNLKELEAKFDPDRVRAREAAVAQAEVRLAEARVYLDELSALDADGNPAPTTDEAQQLREAVLRDRAAIKTLEQGIDPLLALEVERAQSDLAQASLIAPFDGVVIEVMANAGDVLFPGTPVVRITDPAAVEIRTTVIEEDLPFVQVGQSADVFFDAEPDAAVVGNVARITPARVGGQDRPLYNVYIAVDGVPATVLPGMTADASLVVAERAGALRLPRSLVRGPSGGTAILKVWDGVSSTERTVEVGLKGDVNVEIVSGLSEGDRVVAQ